MFHSEVIRSLAKIRNFQREKGTMELFGACILKPKDAFFSYKREVVTCVSENDQPTCTAPKIPVSFRPAGISDIPKLNAITTAYRKRDFSLWINDGYVLCIAQTGNDIIGYECICPASKFDSIVVSIMKTDKRDFWAIDAYILAAYHKQGIYRALTCESIDQARRAGCRRIYGSIAFDNQASRVASRASGIKEIGHHTTIRILCFAIQILRKYKGYDDYFNP